MHAKVSATQRVNALDRSGGIANLELPSPRATLPGLTLRWGEAHVPTTPAYWAAQTWMWTLAEPDHYRLGRDLEEELLACLLGGHGIPAEIGLAAYHRLRRAFRSQPETARDADALFELLSEPLKVSGRLVRYRFARQKADYVAAAFTKLPEIDANGGDRELRDALTSLRGVGPKTASWVIRNTRDSDEVAILDIHILKAGALLGLFDPGHRVERHYRAMEEAWLRFASAISVRASMLDSVVWMTMRQLPQTTVAAKTGAPRRTAPPTRQEQLAF